jgi:tyrosyl-tRNA synthetase
MLPILTQSELFLKSNPRRRPGPSRILPLKRQARKDIEGGGVNLNNVREASATRAVTAGDLLFAKHVLLRKGKKQYVVVTAK